MDPEEGFDNWITICRDLIDDLAQFENLLPGFVRLFNTILETGFLPEEIAEEPDIFIKNQFLIMKLLYIEKPTSSQQKVIRKFFGYLLKLSLIGVGYGDQSLIDFATYLIARQDWPVYNSGRRHLYTQLCQMYIGMGAMDQLLEFMCERCQSFKLFNDSLAIYSVLSKVDDSFDFDKVHIPLINATLRILDLSWTANGYLQLPQALEHFRTMLPEDKSFAELLVQNLSPILEKFIVQNSFDHKRIFLEILQKFIDDKWLAEPTAFFVKNHPDILKNFQFHTQFSEALGDILTGMAKYGLLEKEIIRKVWSFHSSRYDTEIEPFINMFVKMAETAKDDTMSELISCILSSDNTTKIWFNTVDKLIKKVGDRLNLTNEINKIKMKLWEIAFNPNHPCRKNGKESLLNIIGNKADMAIFKDIMREVERTDIDAETRIYCYRLMEDIIEKKLKVPEELFKQVAQRCVYNICNTRPIPDEFLSFLTNTYKNLRLSFEQELLNQIVALRRQSDKIYPFLISLCDNDLIDSEVLTAIINDIPKDEYDDGFYQFIERFLGILNFNQNDQITKLPMQNEDILWRFALEDSPMREQFVNLLCEFYDSNDGVELSDQAMVEHWIKKWSELQTDDTRHLNLLISFIDCIENKIDTDVPSRIPDKQIIKLTAICNEPDFNISMDVGGNSTVGTVCEKIAKQRDVKVSTILAFYKGQELSRTKKLKEIGDFDSLTLDIKYRTSKKGKRSHKRTCWPTLYLKQTDYPQQFYMRLMNLNEKIIYDILNRMQTVDQANEYLKPFVEGINWRDAFIEDKPYFFLYNFTTFINYFLDESMKMKLTTVVILFGADSYFLHILTNLRTHRFDQQPFLTIIYEILRLFRNFQSVNPENIGKLFFELLDLGKSLDHLEAEESKIMYSEIQKTVEYQFGNKKRALNIELNEMSYFNMLLLPDQRKRQIAKDAFDAIKIPPELFISTLSTCTEIYNEFITCLSDHLQDKSNPVFFMKLAEIFFGMIEKPDSKHLNIILKTIDRMLMFNLFPQDYKPRLTEFLINRFFTYDNDSERNESFHSAVNCLTKLVDVVDSSNERLLHKALMSHYDNLQPFSSFSSRNDACLISSAKRVGLVNLSATCYLNSSLQQIFAIPALRSIIINYRGDSDVLRELSHIFTRLQYSTCKSETTINMTKYFKWWGQPLNTKEQQDAVEFIDMLVTTHMMENKDIGKSVRELCQGRMRYHVDGMGVDYHDDTSTQDYTCLEVEITPETTKLSDCIEKLTRPNYFTDQTSKYNTETIGAINAIRRCFIDKAPPILIVHVKRFDYDHSKQQRIKINTHLEVPLELDITPAAEENMKCAPYKLNGVVVHRGITAQGGHYVSYVSRDDNTWTLFNDDDVSVVSKDAMFNETNGSDTSVGYILFYVHPEMLNEYELHPDPDVKAEIDHKNAENRLKTLYFNDNYYELMTCLSTLNSSAYDDILMNFAVKMLPFSPFCNKCQDFMSSLVPRVNPLFTDLLDESYFKVCTFTCPHDSYRKGFCSLIQASFSNENVDKVFNMAFSQIDILLTDSNHMDDTFHVLYAVMMSSEQAKNKYMPVIRERVSKFMIDDINKYLNENPQTGRQYFFSGLDMSYTLHICATFDAVPNELMNDAYLVDITKSVSTPESIAEYVKKFYSEEMFLNFIKNQCRQFRPHRLFTLLTAACPEKCVQTFLSMQIQAIKSDDIDVDRSTAIAICAATESVTKNAIITHRDTWIERFLFHENINVRTNAVAIIAHIVGHEDMKILSSISINQEMYIQQPVFKVNDDTESIHILSNMFAQSLLVQIPTLLKLLQTDVKTKKQQNAEAKPIRANEFVELIEKLINLTTVPLPLERLSVLIGPISQLSIQCTAASTIFKIFMERDVPTSRESLIESVKGAKLGAKKSRSVCEFLENFIPYIRKLPQIPDEVINYFLAQVAFAKPKNIKPIHQMVEEFLKSLCQMKEYNSQVLQYIDSKFKQSCQQNLPNVCIALKILGEKRDVYQFFVECIDDAENVKTTDEIIDLVKDTNIKGMRRQTLVDALKGKDEDEQ